MGIELFDERDNLVSAQVAPLFGLRVSKADGTVDFKFSDEREVF